MPTDPQGTSDCPKCCMSVTPELEAWHARTCNGLAAKTGDAMLRMIAGMTPGEIQNFVDAGLRHKSGLTERDWRRRFLSIGRLFGYATQDDSWGEFEKEFATMVRRLVVAERVQAAAVEMFRLIDEEGYHCNAPVIGVRDALAAADR